MLGLWRSWFVQGLVILLITVALNPGDQATIQWSPGDDKAQWYEVRYRFLDKTPSPYTETVRVDGTSTSVYRPRSGNWSAEVRACAVIEEETKCSVWVKSDEQGEPEPWAIFWKPPPVEGVKVEDVK